MAFKASKAIYKDIFEPAVKELRDCVKDDLYCLIKGHRNFDTTEDYFYCIRCHANWPWDESHDWIISNDTVEQFLVLVADTHKRKKSLNG